MKMKKGKLICVLMVVLLVMIRPWQIWIHAAQVDSASETEYEAEAEYEPGTGREAETAYVPETDYDSDTGYTSETGYLPEIEYVIEEPVEDTEADQENAFEEFPEEQSKLEKDLFEEGENQAPEENGDQSAWQKDIREEIEDGIAGDEVRLLQERIRVWKYENRVIIVFDPAGSMYDLEDQLQPVFSIAAADTKRLLYTGTLRWDPQSRLYWEEIDLYTAEDSALIDDSEGEIAPGDLLLRVGIELQGQQSEQQPVNLEEHVLPADGTVTLLDADTEADGGILISWNDTVEEADGYTVFVFRGAEKDTVQVFDTTESSVFIGTKENEGNQEEKAQEVGAEEEIEIFVSPYWYHPETGVKDFGFSGYQRAQLKGKEIQEFIGEESSGTETDESAVNGAAESAGTEPDESAVNESDVIEAGQSFGTDYDESALTESAESFVSEPVELSVNEPHETDVVGSDGVVVNESNQPVVPEPQNPSLEERVQAEKETSQTEESAIVIDKSHSLIRSAKFIYNGKEQRPQITVYGEEQRPQSIINGNDQQTGEVLLSEGDDYKVTFFNRRTKEADTINVGIIDVTVTGIGRCIGTMSGTYEIVPMDIAVLLQDEQR